MTLITFDSNFPGFQENFLDVEVGEDNIKRNSTLVCASIMEKTVDKMLVKVREAKEEGADLVELRLDCLIKFDPDYDLDALIGCCLPSLVTFRPIWEGGHYKGDEGVRQSALRKAVELGADYIDIELKVADEFIESIDEEKHRRKTAIVVSSHNFENTPSIDEIGELVARIQATGADIVKIATTALHITDNARILQLLTYSQVPMIGIAMGEKGLLSRVLSAKFGGFLTFVSLEGGRGSVSALGQLNIRDLLDLYNFRRIGADTKVHGVIGNPISHSKSPHLYNAAFKDVGFNGIYLPLLVDSVSDYLMTFSSPDFVGYSYTIPHKIAGLECCDEVDPTAKAIGAISCMIRRPFDGKLIGYNIDYMGAIAAIEEGLRGANGGSTLTSPLAGKLMVVIGAGGAGKALAYGGKSRGARLVIADTIKEKAVNLASKVGGKVIPLYAIDDFAQEEGMILANATPVGMQPDIDKMVISKKALKQYSLVFDAIYTPKLTKLLREAQDSGATIVYGTEMFINQAFIQFEKFTGLPAPKELMREVLARNT